MKWKVGSEIHRVQGRHMRDRGEFDPQTGLISIRSGMRGRHRAKIVLHELLHAMWNEYGLPPRDEEPVIRGLENALTALIRDNRREFDRLVKALRS